MKIDAEIKAAGLKALTKALGEGEAEKFISLLLREPFDYTEWHRTLWAQRSVNDISSDAMSLRQGKKPRRATAVREKLAKYGK